MKMPSCVFISETTRDIIFEWHSPKLLILTKLKRTASEF